MRVTLIPGPELSPDLVRRWREIQRSNPDLVSPYFCVEFTQIIAAERGDVEVAIVEEAGSIAAFFPFQRSSNSIGLPVGGILSDYQGLICDQDFQIHARSLLKGCGLIAWDFDHLITTQKGFESFHWNLEPSPQLDLSSGFEAYLREQGSARSIQKKIRQLEKKFGPVYLMWHEPDPKILDKILEWKSQQYAKSCKADLFAETWIRNVIERIYSTQTEWFSGKLTILYCGDRLVAGRLSMQASHVYHCWFPAYNREMAVYSPGLVLTLKSAEFAMSNGVDKLDFGKGMSEHKKRLMNSHVPVASGSVELLSLRAVRRQAGRTLRSIVANSIAEEPMRKARHVLRKVSCAGFSREM